MLPGFEKQTESLNDYELTVLVPLFVERFNNKIGPENAVTNAAIVKSLKEKGYKIDDIRVRAIIEHIRLNDLVNGWLCANGNQGYFISNSPIHIRKHIQSLEGRETKIRMVKHAAIKRLQRITGVEQTKLF